MNRRPSARQDRLGGIDRLGTRAHVSRSTNLSLNGFEEWVYKKYSKSYAPTVVCYAKKYRCMLVGSLAELEQFSSSKKNAVSKALIALSKYLGVYRDFRLHMVDYGVRFEQPNSVDAFLRMMDARHDVLDWVKETLKCLNQSQGLFVEFKLLSGIRTGEAVNSFNMIVRLSRKGELNKYYNVDLSSLEHFKHPRVFLRDKKNVFFTFIGQDFVEKIAASSPISYESIRKRLWRKGLNMRFNELRDYYATFMVHNGLIREEVDLLQGRVGKSLFMKHYFSPAIKELKNRTLKATEGILAKIS